MASTKTNASAANGFTWDDFDGLEEHLSAEAIARQQAYLDTHPDYAPCGVPGCTGIVTPRYVTLYKGFRTGKCPMTELHADLKAMHDKVKTVRGLR